MQMLTNLAALQMAAWVNRTALLWEGLALTKYIDRLTANNDDKRVRDWFIAITKQYGCSHKVSNHSLCTLLQLIYAD